MMIRITCFNLLLLSLVGCSLSSHKTYVKYAGEQVSVVTALNLAKSAYIKACREARGRGSFVLCRDKAVKFVKDDVEWVMKRGSK